MRTSAKTWTSKIVSRWQARGRRRRDGGAVLLVVLLVMMTLLCLGVTTLWLTGGNIQVSASMNLRSQALYCAQAGIERARAFLNTAPAGAASAFLTNLLPGTGRTLDNIPTGLDSDGQPNGFGAVLIDGVGALDNVAYPPTSFARAATVGGAPAATQMGNYTVWIRNDVAESRQGAYTTDTNGSVVVRSRCVAPDGRTNAIIEVTFIPPVGAAWSPLTAECFDTGKNNDDANTNTVHCNRAI
jgi:hypothetical protein